MTGHDLKEFLMQHNIGQAQLARVLEITPQWLNQILSEKSNPSLELKLKIANVLSIFENDKKDNESMIGPTIIITKKFNPVLKKVPVARVTINKEVIREPKPSYPDEKGYLDQMARINALTNDINAKVPVPPIYTVELNGSDYWQYLLWGREILQAALNAERCVFIDAIVYAMSSSDVPWLGDFQPNEPPIFEEEEAVNE